jgi:carbonic anhydrase
MKLFNVAILSCFCLINLLFDSIQCLHSKLQASNKLDYMHFMKDQSHEDKNFKFKSQETKALKYEFVNNTVEGWMAISSSQFRNVEKFPPIILQNGTEITIDVNFQDFRINSVNCSTTFDVPKPIDDERLFFFTLNSQCRLFYTSTPTDLNLFGILDVNKFTKLVFSEDYTQEFPLYCIDITDDENRLWKVCEPIEANRNKWYCLMNRCLKLESQIDICYDLYDNKVDIPTREIKQPIILVPLPSPTCNNKWNYAKHGDDWVCDCKLGKQQSPIDLPDKRLAIASNVRPLFKYIEIKSENDVSTIDGILTKGEKLNLINSQGMLHILHSDMGRIITPDGTIYQAEEITFHTPSNHKINGKQYDLEVTIIHSGVSKGDIGRQATLSFLFERVPGAHNLFFEDFDLFNLPNPLTKVTKLLKSLYIPKLLYTKSDDVVTDIPVLKPFGFYTYAGSIPFPPCTERTIVYVASEPLKR